MENELKTENNSNSYQKIANSWTIIFDFLDINSLLQSEIVSKFFRNQISLYYEAKENTIINKKNKNEKKENEKNLFKKNFLSKYFNLFVSINIGDNKFCLSNPSADSNEAKFELQKISYPKTESNFFKNKIKIEQTYVQDNRFFILYSNNIFSILEFDQKDTLKLFNEIYAYNFKDILINKFVYINEQNLFFIKENSAEIYCLNIKNKEMKSFDLKKEFEIFNEENLEIKDIFSLNEFLLFLTKKEDFILIPNNLLNIFKDNKEDKKLEKEEEGNEDKILYPKKLENNYSSIKYLYSNNSNVILLNNECQIYSIPAADYKNYLNQIPKFKLFSEQKFPFFYTMGGSSNFFLLLEKEPIKPLEEWNNEEVYKWFEEMEFDDYLNIVKNQKITGKDLVYGGKDYFIDFMGMEEDDMKKLNYEINTLKFETTKEMKLWGWGSNKNGQLGLMNSESFVKTPMKINLPNMLDDDTIEKICCGKTYSVLLTKFGNIFITGNYSMKEQSQNTQTKKKKEKNKHKEEHKEKGKKGDKNKEKNKNKENENTINNTVVNNRWVNLSENICYSHYNLNKTSKNKDKNSYYKVKDVFVQKNNLYFIGFYSNSIPFFAVQRKPKFKHLKKGGKFIMSSKVIEYIQEFSKDKISSFKVIYGDSLLKMLESPLDEYLQSEIPFHKIIQIKEGNEVIWDRKKRYFKENFINENINK